MKRKIFLLLTSLLTLSSYGQKKSGNGDGSFNLSIEYLQKIPDQYTIDDLEKDILEWTYNERELTGHSWNEETNDHDIPSYRITYNFSFDGEYSEAVVEFHDDLIIDILVIKGLSEFEKDKLKHEAVKANYVYREKWDKYYNEQSERVIQLYDCSRIGWNWCLKIL